VRFTFLLPSDNLSGGTRVVAVYARQLADLGHDVLVVTCAPDPRPRRERLLQRLMNWGRPLADAVPAQGHVALSGVPHKVMDRLGPIGSDDVPDADFIVATWWETAAWMHAMPGAKGRRIHLIQGYEVWFGEQFIKPVHAALRLPNIKIAISHDLKRTIEGAIGPLGIHVIPNAVDPLQFDAPERERKARPTVGFVYAHAAIKGADICDRACDLAREKLPDLEVVAFGTDTPTASLPLPQGSRFTLRPAQDRLRDQYAACDAWLFGSRLDSFGLPILEAMACRTPVIAVPVGAAESLLAHGGGKLVDKESPQQMADAIVSVMTQSADQWKVQSDAAYRTAHGYTWQDATRQLLQITQVS